MKFYPLIFLSLLIFSACSQDDTMVPEPEEEQEEEIIPSECEEGCMTAMVDGNDFEATVTTAVLTEITLVIDSIPFTSNQLHITGTIPGIFSETKTITLLFACSELGTALSLDDTNPECGLDFQYSEVSFLDPTGAVFVVATSGEVLIESMDDQRIKGTFSFSGIDSDDVEYTITEGAFDAPLN